MGRPSCGTFWTADRAHTGRSPGEAAALRLQRSAHERWLEVDYTTDAPLASGLFEVDGEMLHAFRRGPGRSQVVLDVSRFAGRVLTLRARLDFPRTAASLVVHEAALKP